MGLLVTLLFVMVASPRWVSICQPIPWGCSPQRDLPSILRPLESCFPSAPPFLLSSRLLTSYLGSSEFGHLHWHGSVWIYAKGAFPFIYKEIQTPLLSIALVEPTEFQICNPSCLYFCTVSYLRSGLKWDQDTELDTVFQRICLFFHIFGLILILNGTLNFFFLRC